MKYEEVEICQLKKPTKTATSNYRQRQKRTDLTESLRERMAGKSSS